MALDPNIIMSGQMPKFASPMDTMGQAMTLKNLSMQSKLNEKQLNQANQAEAEQKTMKDLMAKHTVANPDGTVALNKGAMLSDLAKVNPTLALTTQKQFETESAAKQSQDIAQREKQLGLAKDLAWSINDEQSYQQAREMGIKLGLPNADKLPPQYDPNLVQQMKYRTLSAQQQLDEQKRAQDYSLRERELGLKREDLNYKRTEERKKLKDPVEKIAKLNSGDKARFDNAAMALKALDEMGQALDQGENTFSLVGDNAYTAAARRATEAYGRMQSGGAINKDEEERFDKTLPRTTDSKEIQRKKIIAQRNEMVSRLKTLGFTPEDIGYQPKEFKYGSSGKKQSGSAQGQQTQPPQTVIQNGHTYTYNPQTGSYE